MIVNFRHKALRDLHEKNNRRKIDATHVKKLRVILLRLETAKTLKDMDLQTFDLHQLEGNRKGTWAVRVDKNWRVTFRFEDGDAYDVNYEDYH
jgi:proteic killer suppression protein